MAGTSKPPCANPRPPALKRRTAPRLRSVAARQHLSMWQCCACAALKPLRLWQRDRRCSSPFSHTCGHCGCACTACANEVARRVAEAAHARDCPERGVPSAGLKPHSGTPLVGGFHPPRCAHPLGYLGNLENISARHASSHAGSRQGYCAHFAPVHAGRLACPPWAAPLALA